MQIKQKERCFGLLAILIGGVTVYIGDDAVKWFVALGKESEVFASVPACQINDFFHTDVDIKTGIENSIPAMALLLCCRSKMNNSATAIVQPLCVQYD